MFIARKVDSNNAYSIVYPNQFIGICGEYITHGQWSINTKSCYNNGDKLIVNIINPDSNLILYSINHGPNQPISPFIVRQFLKGQLIYKMSSGNDEPFFNDGNWNNVYPIFALSGNPNNNENILQTSKTQNGQTITVEYIFNDIPKNIYSGTQADTTGGFYASNLSDRNLLIEINEFNNFPLSRSVVI